MPGVVGDINEDADEFITIRVILVAPAALDLLTLTGNRAELMLQFEQRIGNQLFGTGWPSLNRSGISIS